MKHHLYYRVFVALLLTPIAIFAISLFVYLVVAAVCAAATGFWIRPGDMQDWFAEGLVRHPDERIWIYFITWTLMLAGWSWSVQTLWRRVLRRPS